MDIPNWRVIESSYVVDSPFLRLRKDTIELPDGTIIPDYYVREGRGFSVIFALTPEHDVILVRQFKYGIGRIMLELPAGIVDAGEDPIQTAARELAEETGYVAGSLEHVRSFVAEPSNSQASLHLFLARDARKEHPQKLDVTESIDVELCTLKELRAKASRGEIESLGQVASIYYVLENVPLA